jgi:hypothetical protein
VTLHILCLEVVALGLLLPQQQSPLIDAAQGAAATHSIACHTQQLCQLTFATRVFHRLLLLLYTHIHKPIWYGLCNLQVMHVEIVRAYGRLVRLVLQHGRLLRQLQSATAALQHEAQLWEEVPAAKEAACYKYKEEIDKISQEIQVM